MADADTTVPCGISEALAASRAARVRDLRCALTFRIPGDRHAPVHGEAHLAFRLSDTAQPLLLDFAPARADALRRLTVNGVTVDAPLHQNGHIVIRPESLRSGANRVDTAFVSGEGPLNRRDDLMYTLFVPARAHEAFPCFDQPSLRARWSLTVEIPAGWTVVANAAERARLDAPSGEDADRVSVAFAETEPLPTYLLAFAAGRLSVSAHACAAPPMRIVHREADPLLLARSTASILRLHDRALGWLESYTGIPYPFAKLDVVLLPAFQFSGMEHPGAIYYDAGALLLDDAATPQQLIARAHLVAHETAHMWFGNLVTMRWFSDVWMKEVFANLMAAKIVAGLFPEVDDAVAFLQAHHPAAYDVDRTAGTNPIRQPLADLREAGSLYGPIVYLKSAIVMRQLERTLGADAVRDALRRFLRQFRFGDADWPDLLGLLQAHTPVDLGAWSRDWILEAGRPTIRVAITARDGCIAQLAVRTSDPVPERGCRWPQPIDVALGYADRVEHLPVFLDGETDVRDARGRPAPSFVLANGGGLEYGAFRLDAHSRDWLLEELPAIGDPLTRASAWIALWDGLLERDVQPQAFLNLMLRGLTSESNELTTARILAYLERTFWILISDAERVRCASQVEEVLRGRMADASAAPAKAAFFSTLRSVAVTPATLHWLEAVWRRDEAIPGLPLGEGDRIALVKELAIRDVAGADALIDTQIRTTADGDRRAALTFVRSALSPKPEERLRFFQSLQPVENRRREPWAIDGLRWLHHPLRQALAVEYLEPGLAMLEEIRRTGDIFFPRRWADALLAGHGSPAAADAVGRFLESRPVSYPDALRRVVLVASDLLRRASPAARRPGTTT